MEIKYVKSIAVFNLRRPVSSVMLFSVRQNWKEEIKNTDKDEQLRQYGGYVCIYIDLEDCGDEIDKKVSYRVV
jgi:hypothetical protein